MSSTNMSELEKAIEVKTKDGAKLLKKKIELKSKEQRCELCNITCKSWVRHLKSKQHLQAEKASRPELEPEYTETEQELIRDMDRATARIGWNHAMEAQCPLCSKINTWDENRLLIEILNNKLDQVIRNQGILLESIAKRVALPKELN